MRIRSLTSLTLSLWVVLTLLEGLAFVSRAVFNAEQTFNHQVSLMADSINLKVLANEAVIDSYAAYSLVAGEAPGNNERLFVRQIMRRYPQLVSMERVVRVELAKRSVVLGELRRAYGDWIDFFGYDHFVRRYFSQLSQRGPLYPVVFVEPMTLAGNKVLGMDLGFSEYLRAPLQESIEHARAASSRPYPLIEGQMGYLLIRPAEQAFDLLKDNVRQSRRFVALVVNSEPFVPAPGELAEGMRVRMWHKHFNENDPQGRFFDRGDRYRSSLEVLLFPRLESVRQIGSESQPFMLRMSWQLGWSQVGRFEWGVMAVLSLAMLVLLYFGLMGLLREQEARRSREHQLFFQAHHDQLTGLANRSLFYDRLQHAINRQSRVGHRLAVLFLDLNRFKPVNDTYGHAVGDQVLHELARRLTNLLRAQDTVARLGGDEFVVLVEDVRAPQEVEVIVERIKAAVEEPIEADGHRLQVGVSVGVAYYPEDGMLIDELLAAADRKMYGHKEAAR
jgi:diguanylate cyclase (GGDEF)-like protein